MAKGKYLDELGKPVLAVILTHAHPDHYGGVPVIIKDHPNASFITTKTVAKGLRLLVIWWFIVKRPRGKVVIYPIGSAVCKN
jgi:glyoxylase-like metal-dependent hydrolase (beta-lactamase superfamily II)